MKSTLFTPLTNYCLIGPAKKKKKWATEGNANEFDLAVDQKVIIGSAIARVRRQQIKVVDTIKEHITCMETFKEHGDNCVHVIIENYLKPKADLRSLIIPEKERTQVFCKPGVWELEALLTLTHSILVIVSSLTTSILIS